MVRRITKLYAEECADNCMNCPFFFDILKDTQGKIIILCTKKKENKKSKE